MEMRKLLIVIAAGLICTPCLAAPKKTDAEKWLSDFRAAREKTGDALFLSNPAKRSAHMQTLMKLRDRSEQVFGQQSDCSSAATGLVGMWGNEIDLARGGSNSPYMEASSLAGLAWESGQSYGNCRNMIDGMK